jgi:hypothetical protein
MKFVTMQSPVASSLLGPNIFQWRKTQGVSMMISKTYFSLFREEKRLKKQKLLFLKLTQNLYKTIESLQLGALPCG